MIRSFMARGRAGWGRGSAVGMLCLLGAILLTACGTGSPGGTGAFPKGTLHVWSVPNESTLPGQVVRGPDGNVWFPSIASHNFTTNQPSGALGRVTPAGQFQLFPLPDANSYPTALTFASDGSVWFVAFQGNGVLAPNVDSAPSFTEGYSELGHWTKDGQFHFFRLPAPDAFVTSIAAGPDGNLWFTENFNATDAPSIRIGRMTPTGAFTEFAVAAPFAHPYLRQIMAGPDGDMWFSLEGADAKYNALGALGKITPAGTMKIMPLGTFDVPEDMTVGPDHNIWFTTSFEVGRVTPDGKMRLFDPDPHANANNRFSLGGITTGPDGNLWFATDAVQVGRVTTSGSFSFYPLPYKAYFDNGGSSLTLGDLKGIVTGADGALWLTDAGQIGQFV